MTARMPLSEKKQVTAALFGHVTITSTTGTVAEITLSAATVAHRFTMSTNACVTQKVMSIENFVWVRVTEKTAQAEAVSIAGAVIDSFDRK